ncbi:MAG: hypothetical protein RLY86_65 [Pseudomonadota bacterium]|jgi:prepilin-type N-terminal cleavage/methylation domain-containing protein
MGGPRRREAGFSLIELAIVIAIVGLISVTGLNLLAGSVRATQTRTTQDRLDLATEAILAFYMANNRLPCPADGDLAPGDTGYGTALGAPGACTITGITSDNGVLPWRTLGLPDQSSMDGWNRLLGYRVSPELTAAPATTPVTMPLVRYQGETTGGIPTAFVVMSHGRNGLGAWLPVGNRAAQATASTNELENLDDNTVLIARAQTPPAGETYDDILVWLTPQQMVIRLGGGFTPIQCLSAGTLVSSPTADVAALANAVAARCL